MNRNNNDYNYNPFEENNDSDYLYQVLNRRGRKKTYGWSIAAMVCAIVSVVSFLSPISAIILGVLAIVFSLISRKSLGYFDGKAVAGLILGIIGLLLGTSMLLLILINESAANWLYDLLYGSYYVPEGEQTPSQNPQSPNV